MIIHLNNIWLNEIETQHEIPRITYLTRPKILKMDIYSF